MRDSSDNFMLQHFVTDCTDTFAGHREFLKSCLDNWYYVLLHEMEPMQRRELIDLGCCTAVHIMMYNPQVLKGCKK